jgi:cytoskeleton protein RodZ
MSIMDQTATVGERIAAEREQRGMTIEQMSAQTRIRPSVLYGIESDDYTPCGGTVYARGHIRTLARTLGLDEQRLLDDFDRLHPQALPPLAVEAVTSSDSSALRVGRSDSPRWLPVSVAVMVLVCIVAVVELLLPRSSTPTMPAAPSASPSARAKLPPPGTAPAPKTYTGVNVMLKAADGQTWLHAAGADGHLLMPDGMLDQGAEQTFRDPQSVHLRLGNAGAVQVSCNGRSAASLGAQGQVVDIDFSASSPACAQQ